MQYNRSNGRGKVYGLKLVQDESHIHLGTVLKDSSGSFTGVHGKITTCDADEPHFYLNASRVKVIPDNKALFSAANLVFQGIPTPIALPFGLAPLKKGQRDGILFPSLGFNSFNQSFYLQNFGYYIGLGQHSDIQINTDAYLN
ncbi:MAG: putative LPS assembly protein LptD, partial [Bacteroidota bacterium]|nr:putative LPS assembly protein LptD [Bacteroidota bacterium]